MGEKECPECHSHEIERAVSEEEFYCNHCGLMM